MGIAAHKKDFDRQNELPHMIRELRGRLGLTQEKFAAKIGVTLLTVNRWENGRTKPIPLALKRIEELARGLGEDGSDLIEQYFPKES